MVGGISTNQIGACYGSNQRCINGSFVDYFLNMPDYQVVESRCDGIDNDCDNIIDPEGMNAPNALMQQGYVPGRYLLLLIYIFLEFALELNKYVTDHCLDM